MWSRKVLPVGAAAALLLLGSNVASATAVDVSGTDGLQSGGETTSEVLPAELVPSPGEGVSPLTVGDRDLGAESPEADAGVSDGNQPAPIAAGDWGGLWEVNEDVLTIHEGILPSTSCAVGGVPWAGSASTIKEVVFTDAGITSFGESTACMFSNMTSLTAIPDIGGVYAGDVINVGGMFRGASSLEELDLSDWDTGKVTNMSHMFRGASSLEMLKVSGWETGQVEDMYYMFYGARSLEELDVSGWDTSQVVDMFAMFYGASSLEALDVSEWDTSLVLSMGDMFLDTVALRELTLGADSAFTVDAGLGTPKRDEDGEFTGFWQLVGDDGSVEAPRGNWRGRGPEVLELSRSDSGAAGTYVWQPWVTPQGPTMNGPVVTIPDVPADYYEYMCAPSSCAGTTITLVDGQKLTVTAEARGVNEFNPNAKTEWMFEYNDPKPGPDPEPGPDPKPEPGPDSKPAPKPGPDAGKPGGLAKTGSNLFPLLGAAAGLIGAGAFFVSRRKKLN